MPHPGHNFTHLPRENSHNLTMTERLRCKSSSGEFCETDHRRPDTALTHCQKLAEALPGTAWAPAPTYLIPQYSTTDLKDRGWTVAMINRLLGYRDSSEDAGPGRAPRHLYDSYRVHDEEIRPTFQASATKQLARNGGARPVRSEPPSVLAARTVPIHVTSSLDPKTLRDLAIAHITKKETDRMMFKYHDHGLHIPKRDVREMAKDLIDSILADHFENSVTRWQVEFLYETSHQYHDLKKHTHAGRVVSTRIHTEIAKLYPHIATEATQMSREAAATDASFLHQMRTENEHDANRPPRMSNLTNLRWSSAPPKRKKARSRRAA